MAREVVFVGGATVSLYADRPAGETRHTDEVDLLVELLRYRDYATVEEQLRQKGFTNDVESGMICRDRINGIIVDVMPTGENALGFTNPWYEKGYVATVQYELEKGCVIKISHPVYFLASKIAAFNDRRGGDGRRSSDFEDLVFVLNNRTRIWQELSEAKGEVASLLKKE